MKKSVLFLIAGLSFTSAAFAQCGNDYGVLVINEFMARNIVYTDQDGEFDDWVEIHNTSDENINLQGYFLSDGHSNRTKFQFPDTVIDGGGYIVVWCDGDIEQAGLHTSFSLNGTLGERLVLSNPDTVVIDHFDFGSVDNIKSFSRYPNGHGPFRFAIPSPDAPNNETDYRGLVINEFLAINDNSGTTDEYGIAFDWIELYNNRDIPLNLAGYFLSDKSNTPEKYQFPDPTILASGGYITVFAAGAEFTGLSDFHAGFSLSGDGEYVHLYNKDTVTLDYVKFGQQLPDVSVGRYENGTGPFRCLVPSFNEPNVLSTVSVEEIELTKELMFSVYPVPATNYINIQLTDTDNGVAYIFNTLGAHITSYAYQGDGPHYIDLSDFEKGVYLIKIGTATKRFIVQ